MIEINILFESNLSLSEISTKFCFIFSKKKNIKIYTSKKKIKRDFKENGYMNFLKYDSKYCD